MSGRLIVEVDAVVWRVLGIARFDGDEHDSLVDADSRTRPAQPLAVGSKNRLGITSLLACGKSVRGRTPLVAAVAVLIGPERDGPADDGACGEGPQ